jgi:hypothetical protein
MPTLARGNSSREQPFLPAIMQNPRIRGCGNITSSSRVAQTLTLMFATRSVASPPHAYLVFTAIQPTGWLELWVGGALAGSPEVK